MTTDPDTREVVYNGRWRDCAEISLVLESAGVRFQVTQHRRRFSIIVGADDVELAREEILQYRAENSGTLRHPPHPPTLATAWAGVAAYAVILLTVAICDVNNIGGIDWTQTGKTHAGSIQHGHWFRAVTALTLHSDLIHLAANIIFGGLVGIFAGQMLGAGLGWSLTLLGGVLGNILNAWVHPPSHTSIGASTAVFATLGLIAGVAFRQKEFAPNRLQRWAPLVSAAVLLSFLGTGGERTDVLAHVCGFAAGILLGVLCGQFRVATLHRSRTQCIASVFAALILGVAWWIAIAEPVAAR